MPTASTDGPKFINPKYVKIAYRNLVDRFLTFISIAIVISVLLEAIRLGPDEVMALWRSVEFDTVPVLVTTFVAVIMSTVYFMSRPRPICLVDHVCYKPPESCRFPAAKFMMQSRQISNFDPISVDFQMKILERSGLGNETSLPPALHHVPHNPTIQASREEAELVIFSVIDSLLEKTGVKPKDIDILIVNCSLFSPTPSLSAMVVNKYKMRSNIQSYNLAGMGCSAGLISIDLAKDLLHARPNSYALVISTEIITQYWYTGNQRSMLLANCLFRMGGASILLSNKRAEAKRAKYSLCHLVRTHKGADDSSYHSVYEEEDKEGKIGISLSKDLMTIAGAALRTNITTLGPLVLPISEQLLFLFSLIGRKVINPKWKPYIPDFKQAFDHFCIHAGGRGVIEELGKNLRLSPEHVEASKMTLHCFGNTSSSSPWYELDYIEAKGRMKKGDRVWQIALGSGFKCNSAVWRCNRTVKTPTGSAWDGFIDKYPVHIPDVHKV
ncbi:3-ketoacyl-CoA synthase 5-like [Magnolia sinica]|uniref:3-ketoacyl-CoA synthase 5-like n=1 Tax=Magnolia sinica TaxID=86752 RepID=UPI002657C6E5|nr:3-ketoacyl-CoA synthase 5-like [Magnolia sinica]